MPANDACRLIGKIAKLIEEAPQEVVAKPEDRCFLGIPQCDEHSSLRQFVLHGGNDI